MTTKIYFGIIFAMLAGFANQAHSQPYYLYRGSNDSTMSTIFIFNFQNGVRDVFYSDTLQTYFKRVLWDPTQQWVFSNFNSSSKGYNEFVNYNSDRIINTNNQNINHVFPDPCKFDTCHNSFYWEYDHKLGQIFDGIVFNPIKNVFYVTWFLAHPDSLEGWDELSPFQRTAVYAATTFAIIDTLPVPPEWINSLSSVSDDGNYLYLEKLDFFNSTASNADSIGKYSLLTKQLVVSRRVSDIIVPGVRKGLGDSKKGKYLVGYCYPNPELSDGKYALYDIDRDSSVVTIPFGLESEGYVSSDGKLIIIEETPLRPDYKTAPEAFFHTGRISIFDGISGTLLQRLKLPQDGKVLVFDKYPGMLYYYYEKKQTSINIDLSKLPTIGTISSQNVLVGSGAFTLSITGKNFTTTSGVQLNVTNRATKFVSDTLLEATIRAGDVDTAATAYIAVRDSIASSSHATTDSLALNVISVPQQMLQPILDCVTQVDDTTYTAWFGYENDDTTSIYVPAGPMNKFSPTPNDRTQPTVFAPGKQDKAFSVTFNGKNLTWKLNGNEVTASKKSTKCN